MPLIINDDNTVKIADSKGKVKKSKNNVTPSFFNAILTGHGGNSRGLLNEKCDPKNFPNGYPQNVNPNLTMSTTSNGNTIIYDIPMYILNNNMYNYINEIDRPDITSLIKIATMPSGNDSLYMDIKVHAVSVEEKKTYPNYMANVPPKITKTVSANFNVFIYHIYDINDPTHIQVPSVFTLSFSGNTVCQCVTSNLFEFAKTLYSDLTSIGYIVDQQMINDTIMNYSLYDGICKAADECANHSDYWICDVFAYNLNKRYVNTASGSIMSQTLDEVMSIDDEAHAYFGDDSLSLALMSLEKYNIPIQQFQNMYNKLKTLVSPEVLAELCKSHINLMLADTLSHMEANKNNLKYCPNNNTSVVSQSAPFKYSSEQKAAITSQSPLTLVQSGAGTGKSTIIQGRIDHMIANGINPEDILVLSFTNNAADHILEKCPNINSMTIDRMMRLIYDANYPTHKLSSISTILNSISIYYNQNQDDFIRSFKRVLQRLRDSLEYTRAVNFIEKHLSEVIDVLNTIEQTSLELQSIICYLQIDTLKEPAETKADHLIIDEVQDNSVFQFIYSIKYVDRHQCSMYIVGDCSQTLYEFRASNPKALNMLEGSGVFDAYKLQTNYRSNQEILDFANIGLSNIESNQYAKIQLKANSLKPVTLNSFKQAVNFHYERMMNKSRTAWSTMFAKSINVMASYIKDKFSKGESVTILARRRSDIYNIKENLLRTFPTVPVFDNAGNPVMKNGKQVTAATKIVSLIPQRQYDNTILSKFIAEFWDIVTYTPPTDILDTILTELNLHAAQIAYRSDITRVLETINSIMVSFKDKYFAEIQAFERDVQNGLMSKDDMMDEIKKMLINFEIERNGIAQALMSARNNDAKNTQATDSANVIVSTIHSAKGLEFDNVIVYYDNESESTMSEASKRMYYVALTRAKKTEFVFAYGTLAKPKIGRDYDNIIQSLTNAARSQINSGSSASPDDTDDDSDNDMDDDIVSADIA